jgi:hypothetical protein
MELVMDNQHKMAGVGLDRFEAGTISDYIDYGKTEF